MCSLPGGRIRAGCSVGAGGPGGSVLESMFREAKGFWSPEVGPERGMRLFEGRDIGYMRLAATSAMGLRSPLNRLTCAMNS
jgi:hypothetical protein